MAKTPLTPEQIKTNNEEHDRLLVEVKQELGKLRTEAANAAQTKFYETMSKEDRIKEKVNAEMDKLHTNTDINTYKLKLKEKLKEKGVPYVSNSGTLAGFTKSLSRSIRTRTFENRKRNIEPDIRRWAINKVEEELQFKLSVASGVAQYTYDAKLSLNEQSAKYDAYKEFVGESKYNPRTGKYERVQKQENSLYPYPPYDRYEHLHGGNRKTQKQKQKKQQKNKQKKQQKQNTRRR